MIESELYESLNDAIEYLEDIQCNLHDMMNHEHIVTLIADITDSISDLKRSVDKLDQFYEE